MRAALTTPRSRVYTTANNAQECGTGRRGLPLFLNVDEAAELLRTTRRAIYAMVERRQLPGVVRLRRRVLFRADDLLDWLDQKRAPSPEEGRERKLFERLMDPATHTPRKEVPTLHAFAPRFLDGHARANRQKPSGIAAKALILRVHLLPALGDRRLDTITNEDVQRLKSRLQTKSPKTVNNVLSVLNTLLKRGVEWGVIKLLEGPGRENRGDIVETRRA